MLLLTIAAVTLAITVNQLVERVVFVPAPEPISLR